MRQKNRNKQLSTENRLRLNHQSFIDKTFIVTYVTHKINNIDDLNSYEKPSLHCIETSNCQTNENFLARKIEINDSVVNGTALKLNQNGKLNFKFVCSRAFGEWITDFEKRLHFIVSNAYM